MNDLDNISTMWFSLLISIYVTVHHIAVHLIKSKTYTLHAVDKYLMFVIAGISAGFKILNEKEFTYIAVCSLIIFSMIILWKIIIRGDDV